MKRIRRSNRNMLKQLAWIGLCLCIIEVIMLLSNNSRILDGIQSDEKQNRMKAYIKYAPDVKATKAAAKVITPSTYDELLQLDKDVVLPHNLNIVMMADSITRYQYLSLVYFLSYGKWVENDDRPNIVLEKTHNSWIDFYNYTNEILQPNELCDCYRGEKERFVGRVVQETIENRYFYDPIRNNSVVYLQKYGQNAFHSNWNVKDIKAFRKHHPKQILDRKYLNYQVDTKNWTDIIDNFVCQLEPKPSLFIFNQGLWGPSGLDNVDVQKEIFDALNKCGIHSMYKTTTKWRNDNTTTIDNYENDLCIMSDHCYDLSWTGMLPTEMYWDRAHFLPIVYNWINILLLNQLSAEKKT